MSTEGDRWVYKRDPTISLPLDRVVWTKDGMSYLRPEVQLLHKARGLRPKDQEGFEAVLPFLEQREGAWLRESLMTTQPNHVWLKTL